jgi:hypothetical protein
VVKYVNEVKLENAYREIMNFNESMPPDCVVGVVG